MLVGKGLYLGSVSTLNGLVLVPFYVSVVPVLSLVFMRELWIWSRNAMRFDSIRAILHRITAYSRLRICCILVRGERNICRLFFRVIPLIFVALIGDYEAENYARSRV
jgi:hypothetical protein